MPVVVERRGRQTEQKPVRLNVILTARSGSATFPLPDLYTGHAQVKPAGEVVEVETGRVRVPEIKQ